MMQVITLTNVHKTIDSGTLFKINKATINQGDRIGIVGVNGSGKSTLLQMLVGMDTNYYGEIRIFEDFAYVPQIKEISTQSGGEQTMAQLQEAFVSGAPLLLLDEPTANLDSRNQEQLLADLKAFKGTLVVVSHDRAFLNQTVDQIWEMDRPNMTIYGGNYEAYEQQKANERAGQQRDFENYQKKLNRLESEAQGRIERAGHLKNKKKSTSSADYKVMGYSGRYDGKEKSLAKSGKALQKRIDQLEKVEKPTDHPTFIFREVGRLAPSSQTLIHLSNVEVGVADRHLFTVPDFKLSFGDKVAIRGPNQSGKTTFLKGLLKQKYRGYYSNDLSVGYFSQNLDVLNPDENLLDNVLENSLQPEYLVRNILASLGYDYSRLHQLARTLSGGERVRLSLAKVLVGDYNLLLLDEPTNYLDIKTLEAVEDFIHAYPGVVVLVSHDQAFVETTTDQHYFIEEGQLVTEVYKEDYANQNEQKLALLRFRLSELMMNDDSSLEDIKNLQKEIEKLEQ